MKCSQNTNNVVNHDSDDSDFFQVGKYQLCLIRSGLSYDNRDTKENYFMTLESRWGACLALHNTQTYEPLIRHGGYCQNFKI